MQGQLIPSGHLTSPVRCRRIWGIEHNPARLVIELDAVTSVRVNGTTLVATALLLIFLLGEALALGHNQILVGFAAPTVRVVFKSVRAKLLFDLDVLANAREGLVLHFAKGLAAVVRVGSWVWGQRRVDVG